MSTTSAGASGNADTANTLQVPTNTHAVKVSLRVDVDVSGTVDIFTGAGNTVNNVVVCSVPAAAIAFYQDASRGILEYWEPSSDRGNILGAAIASSLRKSASGSTTNPGPVLQASLQGSLDASAAPPFNQYAGASNYTTYAGVGELALALHAEYLFGHPQATAAIDNDVAIVNFFNSAHPGANLGARLVNELNNLSDSDATGIVRQVISQDPSRAAGADNSELVPDMHQCLPFYAGDTIYVSVTFKQPSITSGNPSGAIPYGGGLTSTTNNMPAGSASAFPSAGAQLTFEILLN